MAELTPDIPKVELAIVELTNAFRAEQKLAPVKINAKLTAVARAYATFLAKSNLFSHTADGRQHSDRAKSAGYVYCQVSENLALNLDSLGFETRQLARDAVEGWKNSPGHRRNLVAPYMTEIGVGVAKAHDKAKYLSVQLFGRPESLKYAFKVHNGIEDVVVYRFGSETFQIKPRSVITHTACQPEPIVFERAGSLVTGKALKGTYEARNGDLFTIKGSTARGIVIDVSSATTAPVVRGSLNQ